MLFVLSNRLPAEISLGQARHAAGTCDGAVPVIANGTAGPFELRVVGDNGYDELFDEFTDTLLVENLCPGNYDFLIANRFLCEVVLSTTIYTCPTLLSAVTQPSCGQFNGRIQLSLSGGDVPNDGLENYIFQWADGPATPNRRFVRPGEYCVTVTNETSGCVLTECFEMIDETPSVFTLRVDEVTNPSFPDREDGRISVYLEPPGNYQYQWSTGAEGPVLGGLNPGTYEVTATDGVCEQVRSFTLGSCYVYGDPVPGGEDYQTVKNFEDFEVRIVGGLVDPHSETVEVRLQYKGEHDADFREYLPPGHRVEWLLNGFFAGQDMRVRTFPTADILAMSGSPSIRAVVSNGCAQAEAQHIFWTCGGDGDGAAGFFVRADRTERPCDGFGDGLIYVEIPNPDDLPVTVSVNGVDYSDLVLPGDPAVLTLGNLDAGDFQFEITIGGCVNSFLYKLSTEPNEKSFRVLEEGDICVYEESCRDVELGDYRYPAELRLADTRFSRTSPVCLVPALCNNVERGVKIFPIRKMYVWQWKQLILLAKSENNSQLPPSYLSEVENYYGDLSRDPLKDCQKVNICPANLERGLAFSNPLTFRRLRAGPDEQIDGCIVGKCGNNVSRICPQDFPWSSAGGLEEFNNCNPVQASIYQLLLVRHQLERFVMFDNSDLENRLDEYSQVGNPAYFCAEIIFCSSDFSIKYDNLEEVNCNARVYVPSLGRSYEACELNTVTLSNNDKYQFIVCPNGRKIVSQREYNACPSKIIFDLNKKQTPQKDSIEIENIPPPSPPPPPIPNTYCEYTATVADTSFDEKVFVDKVIFDFDQEEILREFFKVRNEGVIIPKGLIDYKDSTKMLDYSHTDQQLVKQGLDFVNLLVDDWDTDQTIYTQTSDPGQNYHLLYQDSLREWSRLLEGSDTLLLSHLSKTDSAIFLGGRFQGALTVEGASVAFSASPSGFLLKFSPDGELIGDHFVHGLAPGSRLHFSENRQGELVIFGQYETPDILINGAAYNLQANPNGIFALLVDRNDQLQLLTYADVSAGQLEPAGVAFSRDGQLISLAYSGAGDLNQPGEPALRLPYSNSLAVMTLDRTGQRQWMTTYDGQVLDAEHFAMDYGRAGSLFLALTFTDTLKAPAEELKLISAGKNDIALLKYDQLFNLEWSQTFGTEDEENVSQILCDSTAIFFGGEFSGAARERLLGNYNFINLTDTVQRAYISYVFDEQPAQQARYREGGLNLESATPVAETFRWKVYPNPFSTTVNVEVFGEDGRYLEVNNIFGQRLHRREIRTPQRQELELGVHGPGVYFIKVLDESGRILGVEKVVKR